MTTIRVLVAAFLALLVVVASGCGGGGGGGDSETLSPELIQKADAICKRQRTQIQALRQPATPGLTAVARYLAQVIPIAAEANAELHALETPKGHQADWQRLLQASDTSLKELQRMRAAARGRARIVYGAARDRLGDADQQFLETATNLGLVTCGTPS